MLMLYVLLFALNIVLFIFLGIYGVLVTLAIQFTLVLFADKVYAKMGSLKVTEKNQTVHVLQYQLPTKEYEEFRAKFGKDAIRQMKTEIYDRTLALGREPTCELGEEVFKKYGMKCSLERRSAKAVNVYQIVKTAAERFHMPMPKIVISNSMMPNAAATGPSPGRGVILITTGLLVELEDDEILSVVGHELGHLQGRDPLILFGLTSTEFLLRVFVFLPLFLFSPFLYLVFAMGIVYFIAKFFEARADLQSALKIGQPKALAEALEKIGFQKLQYERIPTFKIQSWMRWDPHPPTYFRIDRLRKMRVPAEMRHPLVQSAKDVFKGFRSAI
jgi:heat shock protein HtpX